jgi:hypothetical protein
VRWFRKRDESTGSIDVDAAIEKTKEAKQRLSLSLPRVNQLSSFFEQRKGQNGFGEDFEYTIESTLDHRPQGI